YHTNCRCPFCRTRRQRRRHGGRSHLHSSHNRSGRVCPQRSGCRSVRRSYEFFRRSPMMLPPLEKITSRHRERAAYVYVRQSTPKQVQQHLESQRNQYALVQRALALGWPSPRIHVIDADLGHSGQDSQRPGFQELVTAVSLGKVGIILAYEASRLARNSTTAPKRRLKLSPHSAPQYLYACHADLAAGSFGGATLLPYR